MEKPTIQPVQAKPMIKSKTIIFGGAVTTVGILAAILQILDLLEPALASMNPEDLPGWFGLVLAIIGGIQIWLRTVTSQPVRKTKPIEPSEPDEK